MENSYVKQFPDLLKGKKIMYVHGFGSSGQSGTVRRLRTVFPNATVIAPDLPLHPEEAIALLHQLCRDEQPDIILGTSMGGMYTEQLRGFDRVRPKGQSKDVRDDVVVRQISFECIVPCSHARSFGLSFSLIIIICFSIISIFF